jgi:hypothetical protein
LQTCIKGFPNLRKLRFGQRLGSWFVVRIVGVGPPLVIIINFNLADMGLKKQQNTRKKELDS